MSTKIDWVEEDDDGFIKLVGPIFHRTTSNESGRFRFHAEAKHKNRAGYVQGGMLMTLADRAMGKTARQGDPTRAQATVQFDMQFLEPVKIGETVEISCTIVRETRQLVFMRGELFVQDRQVASAHGVWKIIARR
ncbi:PaaI family thioesterase [Agrobacterium pusense]|uniref:PaaI family thioesterase n=1 Tax=Agrobacterium pusense TaxID=648995 RepID=A0AA44EK63_9HYPH|nr:PaaI family thioesterase [Agrobacterium pusense]NRF08770.1 PaaI family thioesterase [Agrobacterium pusense]NRF20324.1 PaaI family thioesterase [Agrobacterium pusense]WFN87548.1 PaaI family thioesterase [Agrobacterium pusense]